MIQVIIVLCGIMHLALTHDRRECRAITRHSQRRREGNVLVGCESLQGRQRWAPQPGMALNLNLELSSKQVSRGMEQKIPPMASSHERILTEDIQDLDETVQ